LESRAWLSRDTIAAIKGVDAEVPYSETTLPPTTTGKFTANADKSGYPRPELLKAILEDGVTPLLDK